MSGPRIGRGTTLGRAAAAVVLTAALGVGLDEFAGGPGPDTATVPTAEVPGFPAPPTALSVADVLPPPAAGVGQGPASADPATRRGKAPLPRPGGASASPSAPSAHPGPGSAVPTRPGGSPTRAPKPTGPPTPTARPTSAPPTPRSSAPGTPPSTPAPAPPPPSAAPSPGANYAAQVIALVNVQRAQHGCKALRDDGDIDKAAYGHSQDMGVNNYFAHNTPSGVTPWTRMKDAGYDYPSAENIARGYSTPQDVVTAWMNSPDHRANILNCSYKATGVGYYNGPAAVDNGPWWTQDFGYK